MCPKRYFLTVFSSGFICFSPCFSIVFVCFLKAFSNREYDKADIFDAFLLISYCNCSSLILSSIVMISFYIISERFFLKCKRLSDARVA